MFAKLIISFAGVLLTGVMGLGPAPNTPFLDSLREGSPTTNLKSGDAVDSQGPAVVPGSVVRVDQSTDNKSVDVVSEKSSADSGETDREAPTATLHSEQNAGTNAAESPHITAKVEMIDPAPVFTPGLLAKFRLRCGHTFRLHLS